MRRTRKRLPIPQHEFGFVPDTFTLFTETTADGEKLCREREELERARRQQEDAQTSFFATPTKTP